MREELGDVLIQVVFHAQLAEEQGHFNLDDVAREINEKLIRRHPHVFGTGENSAPRAKSSSNGNRSRRWKRRTARPIRDF